VSALLEVAGVLGGISFAIGDDELVALVGANGAGKTTVAHVLAGLQRPGAGTVRFAGHDIGGADPARIARLGLAYVPAGRRVFGGLTVAENLRLGAYRDRRDRAAVAARLERVHGVFGLLAARPRQLAATLSGGEQQLLAIACGLMSAPRLLIVDEPSAGLAPRAAAAVATGLAAVRSAGTAVLLVEQDLQLVRRIADRILLLDEGRLVLDAPRATALMDPRLERAILGSVDGLSQDSGKCN
jgi:branched-chain amino acid transport system ATP-binding protein